MAEIPHTWRSYARLQQQAGRYRRIDALSWAVEAGLDHLLDNQADASEVDDTLTRIVSSARRREVYRDGVLRRLTGENHDQPHPEAALQARVALEALRRRLTGAEWDILCDVGVGRSYEEIAEARGGTAGGCRVRVLRLRPALALRGAA